MVHLVKNELKINAVILSIKPKFVRLILSGKKTHEFRRRIFRKKVKTAIIYSTHPEKKLVASFSILSIVKDTPRRLWRRFHTQSGLTEKEFFKYFKGCKHGHAIKISDLIPFQPIVDPFVEIPNFNPPQSFCYASFPSSFKTGRSSTLTCPY